MSVHDLCCIGYITQDKIVTTKNTIYMPGGTSFYFAHAIKHLNPSGFLLVTALADRNECCGGYTERGHRGENSAQRPFRLL